VFQLAYVGLLLQPHACTSWSPSSLPFNFPPFVDFCCPSDGITILGIMFGSTSFISYFLWYALDENVCHVDAFPKLKDIQVAFGIFF
jgi:hypothetical protein